MGSKPSHYNLPAIFALLIAATLWGLIWYPLRWLESAGVDGLWASFLMYSACVLVAIPIFVKHWPNIKAQPGLFLLIGLFSGWTNIAFIIAIIDGNVVRVVLFFYLSPLWATLFARVFLAEKLTSRTLAVLAVAMTGAILMLWKPEQGGGWDLSASDWLALSAGMSFAATNVTVRYAQAMPIILKSTSTWIGVLILAIAWLLLEQAAWPQADGEVMLWNFVLGGIAMIIMTFTVQYGVTHMPVQRSAVILLFELIVAAVAAQLLTNEVVLPLEWLGGAFILGASLLAAHQQDVDKNV